VPREEHGLICGHGFEAALRELDDALRRRES
jgi:hypothetical protein